MTVELFELFFLYVGCVCVCVCEGGGGGDGGYIHFQGQIIFSQLVKIIKQ